MPVPRQPRYTICGMPQHVISRGNDRQTIFRHPADYTYYLSQLEAVSKKYGCKIHCYVLMSNHVHLLVSPQQEHGLAKTMQAIGGRYVRYVNRTYNRTGTLFEGRYKASPIDSDGYLFRCYRYIELNPVRAKIVAKPSDYRWSSSRHHLLGRTDPLVSQHELYSSLGRTREQRCSRYHAMFRDSHTTDYDSIRSATNACLPLGDESFKDRIEAVVSRSVRHKKTGRPRKK